VARPSSVQHAIAQVMAELPNIGKGDKSPEGYAYRGIEAITKHVQPLFAKYGVVIAPRSTITDVRPSPAMKDGWQDVYVQVEWDIIGPDGTTITAQTTGIGRDRSDKGANKGQTQAYKYLLLHLLCIADGKDDSDGVSYEHDRHEVTAWNAGMTKAELVNLLGGDKDEARQAWEFASGESLTEFGPEVAQRIADAWQGRPIEGSGDSTLLGLADGTPDPSSDEEEGTDG
jgi:hypothetical protein